MVNVEFSELNIEKLNDNHDLSNFDCGHRDITEFLLEDSRDQMEHNMNVTHLCMYNSTVAAYFTLCADSIKVKKLEDEHKEELDRLDIQYKYLPALKLCRLGVDEKFQGNRIGPNLVETVIQNAMRLSEKIGLRFVSVDAYYHSSKWLYDKYDFKLFPSEYDKIKRYEERPHPNQSVAMYRDIRIKKKYLN